MYNFIDNTKSLGRQYAGPNPGSGLATNAAMAVGEPAYVNNTTVANYSALKNNKFSFTLTQMTIDATGSTVNYPIGKAVNISNGTKKTLFDGVRLYTDYPPNSMDPAFTNVIGTFDTTNDVTGFDLVTAN